MQENPDDPEENRKTSDDQSGLSETQIKLREDQIVRAGAISAGCGAFLAVLGLTPLEVIKTRLQAQTHMNLRSDININGVIDGFIKIIKYAGPKRLWSGFNLNLFILVPSYIVFSVMYDRIVIFLKRQYQSKSMDQQAQPIWVPIIAASTAKAANVILISPVEMMKTKVQASWMSYTEMFYTLRHLVRIRGFSVLYRGVYSTLVRDTAFSASYFTCYESLKIRFLQQKPTFMFSFAAGGFSGAVSAFVAAPFDVVKTYQQIELSRDAYMTPGNIREVLKKIYQQNGFKGLFSGVFPRVLKIIPATAIIISTTETLKWYILDIKQGEIKRDFMHTPDE